ncbi:MAG TPA: hypothetical protein VIS73_07685 [Rhodocyclaceae bacterium]
MQSCFARPSLACAIWRALLRGDDFGNAGMPGNGFDFFVAETTEINALIERNHRFPRKQVDWQRALLADESNRGDRASLR